MFTAGHRGDLPVLQQTGTVPTCGPSTSRRWSNCDRPAEAGRSDWFRLAAEAEATDDVPVALDIVVADVVQKSPATADQLEETTTGVVITLVHLEMLGEVNDALAQYGDLHLG